MAWCGLAAGLLLAAMRLPAQVEPVHAAGAGSGAMAVLRQPVVAWFFAGVFLTVLAHNALYAFFSLYLADLGYTKGTIGLIWALGVAVEVAWFWFQGRWFPRLAPHRWLTIAAVVTALRLAAVAAFGAQAWVLVLAQCTHAITFAAQHTACIAVINQHFSVRCAGAARRCTRCWDTALRACWPAWGGGALAEVFGYAAVFWAASAAAALAAVCCHRAAAHEAEVR